MTERYVIFCDESIKDGSHFSNFFGGVLMSSKHLAYVTRVLEAKKSELQMHGEVKFTKITENYQDKYIELVKAFFALMHEGRIKVTIMFTQNINRAIGLTQEQKRNGYFRLYHQLIRYGFSIQDSPGENPIQLELRFDKFPARNPSDRTLQG